MVPVYDTTGRTTILSLWILFDRADKVALGEKDPEEEKQHILAALQQNGYPRDFMMKTVKLHNRRKERTTEVTEEESKLNKKIDLPYIQGASEQLRRTFSKYNIKTTFYKPTTHRSLLSKPKDPIPKEDGKNVIYQLDCKDCEACVSVFMLEKQTEPSTSEPMSTSRLSNQLAKEATLQNTFGNTTITLIGITREYWILKRIGKPGQSRKQFIQKKINTTSMVYHSNYLPSGNQYYRKTKKRKNFQNSTAKNKSPSNPSPDTSAT